MRYTLEEFGQVTDTKTGRKIPPSPIPLANARRTQKALNKSHEEETKPKEKETDKKDVLKQLGNYLYKYENEYKVKSFSSSEDKAKMTLTVINPVSAEMLEHIKGETINFESGANKYKLKYKDKIIKAEVTGFFVPQSEDDMRKKLKDAGVALADRQ